MKKIYFLFLVIFSNISYVNSQSSILVTNKITGVVIPNNAVIYRGTTVAVEDVFDINVKNISATTKAYKFRRYDDVIAAGTDAYFCVQQCYQPATMVSPTSLTLTPNQDAVSIGVYPAFHLIDNIMTSQSEIRYRIYDELYPSDEFYLTIKYNNPLSVSNSAAIFSSVSNVYPNPSVAKSFINVTTGVDVPNIKLNIINSLGSVVSTKTMDLLAGKNTLSIDTDNLSSGIYFISLVNGNNTIIKKITVSK